MPEVMLMIMTRWINTLKSSQCCRVSRSSYKDGETFYSGGLASVDPEVARRRRINPGTRVTRFLLTHENISPELMGQGVCCQGDGWTPKTSFFGKTTERQAQMTGKLLPVDMGSSEPECQSRQIPS